MAEHKCSEMEKIITGIARRIMSSFPGDVRATDVVRGKEQGTYAATVIATYGGYTRPYNMRIDGEHVSIQAAGPGVKQ